MPKWVCTASSRRCGLAISSGDHGNVGVGGLATAVQDGVTGLLVPGHDPINWGARLAELLEAPHRRAMMSAAAVQHAGRFSWDRTVEATLEVYASACAGVPRNQFAAVAV